MQSEAWSTVTYHNKYVCIFCIHILVDISLLKSVYMQMGISTRPLANVSTKSIGQVQVIDHSQVILRVAYLNSKCCQNLVSNTANHSHIL